MKKREITAWLKPLTEIVGDPGTAREVLSFIEEQEKEQREQRKICQKEGIRIARERGVSIGRPPKAMPANFEKIYRDFLEKHITAEQAARYCGIGLSTFYRKLKIYKKECL